MKALIERNNNGRLEYWTGNEWINTSVSGWRDAASYSDHESAAADLQQHEDEDDFAHATVIDVD